MRRYEAEGGNGGARVCASCTANPTRPQPHFVVVTQLVQGAVAARHLAHRALLGLLCGGGVGREGEGVGVGVWGPGSRTSEPACLPLCCDGWKVLPQRRNTPNDLKHL